jgi:outer membrane immunogenic protein
MTTTLFGTVLFSTVLAAGVAMAADMPVKAPIVSPAWNWTGFYWGYNAGYSWGRASTDFVGTSTSTSVVTATTTGNPPLPLAGNGLTSIVTAAVAGSATADLPGWLGGFQMGFNQQYDWWVLGIETDIQITDEKEDPTVCGTPGCPVGSAFVSSSSKLPWFATLRGRIGATFTPDPNFGPLLFYVTGGGALAEIDSNFSAGLVGGPANNIVDQVTQRVGWVLGAGGEGRITGTNWSFKLEYLYMDLGNVSSGAGLNGTNVVVTPFGINNADMIHHITTTTVIAGAASTHVVDQIFRAGLNYHLKPWP